MNFLIPVHLTREIEIEMTDGCFYTFHFIETYIIIGNDEIYICLNNKNVLKTVYPTFELISKTC